MSGQPNSVRHKWHESAYLELPGSLLQARYSVCLLARRRTHSVTGAGRLCKLTRLSLQSSPSRRCRQLSHLCYCGQLSKCVYGKSEGLQLLSLEGVCKAGQSQCSKVETVSYRSLRRTNGLSSPARH